MRDLPNKELVLRARAFDLADITTAAKGAAVVRSLSTVVAMARAAGIQRQETNEYAAKLVQAVRLTGEKIEELERSDGGRGKTSKSDFASFCDKAQLSSQTARNWQSIYSGYTNEEFEQKLEALKQGDDIIGLSDFYTVRAEKEAVRQEKRERDAQALAKVSTLEQVLAKGLQFTTVVVDPPWDWDEMGGPSRARPTYQMIPVEELKTKPIGKLTAPDAHLYLWITNRILPKGFSLLEAWGFRYVTCLTWCKPIFGVGNYFRGSSEQILFGVKGQLPLRRHDVGTWFSAPRSNKHSEKPEKFFELVKQVSPGPYASLYEREKRDGFFCWGNL
jgi:N6-adenosine-specific RNA methylase IME4